MRRGQGARLAIACVVGLQLAATIALAAWTPLWIDEAYTLETTAHGVVHGFRQAIDFELQPPAYYTLVSAWRLLDPSPWFCRLFSVVCVALSVLLLARVSQRVLPEVPPALTAAALAASPAALWAAIEARPYALAMALAAGLLLAFDRAFVAGDPAAGRRRDRIVFAATAVAALYTQYYLGFVLVGLAAALLVMGRLRALRDYLGWMLVVGAALLPLLLALPGQLSAHTGSARTATLPAALNHSVAGLEDLLLGMLSVPGGRAGRWALRTALAAPLLASLWLAFQSRRRHLRAGQRRGEPHGVPWPGPAVQVPGAVVAVVLGFFVLLQTGIGADLGAWRYMVFVVPAAILLLLAAAALGGARAPVVATALLLVGSGALAVHARQATLAKFGDAARVGAFLSAQGAAGEPVFVFPGEQQLVLERYFQGEAVLRAIPAAASLEVYDPGRFAFRSREEVVRALAEVGSGDTCWLVTYGVERLLGLELGAGWLESVVAAEFETVAQQAFHGTTRARRLRRIAPPGSAAGAPEAAP